jgi:hypothetical protein
MSFRSSFQRSFRSYCGVRSEGMSWQPRGKVTYVSCTLFIAQPSIWIW